ncbi:MAG: TylF/MycF family methyltransferase [Bacteroidetes bacterium]|nr:TylF/MycF family methyltransferase [Bacteroidota bacterium]MCL2303284.1 TylF/MycF family methyltransferase [Lentimicrobiaceae bacterium]
MNILKRIIFKKRSDKKQILTDMDKDFFPLYELCKPYTMTSIERMYALYQAVKHVVKNNIEGDFVECGVWKGGSSMLMAATLNHFKCYTRKIYLYDTFEGMSEPTQHDVKYDGDLAANMLNDNIEKKETASIWAYSPLEEVKKNFTLINYPTENIYFVKGKVEDTIVKNQHDNIALLRLDTDWYESTYHEMTCLYPALTINGVLIIDDYGHWQGARDAIDQYIKENNLQLLLNRIDYTGRMAVKVS